MLNLSSAENEQVPQGKRAFSDKRNTEFVMCHWRSEMLLWGREIVGRNAKVSIDCKIHSRRKTCSNSGLRGCRGSVGPGLRF